MKSHRDSSLNEKTFTYRTVPELRFQSSRNSQRKQESTKKFTLSQKCLQGDNPPQEKVFYKTKHNILLKDYKRKEQKLMNCKSVLMPTARVNARVTHRKVEGNKKVVQNEAKFHELKSFDFTWEKWKRPFSIVRENKEMYLQNNNKMIFTQRSRSLKRCMTQIQDKTKEERDLERATKEIRQKEVERELRELNRIKSHIEEKKEVIGLMNRIKEHQRKVLEKTFGSYRAEVEEMVEYYTNKKFDGEMVIKPRMETSLY